MDDVEQKAGIVAVVGRANVGKSTLVNRILGEKVSIVSDVVQTTRNMVRGVLTEARGQLVLLDTPGVHRARGQLGKLMNKAARASIEGSDVALLVLDGSLPPRVEDDGWMRRLLFAAPSPFLILNKADRSTANEAAYRELWATIQAEKEQQREVVWRTISAAGGDGVDELLALLFDVAPVGPPLFDAETLSDYPRKLAIADCIREKLYAYLRDELPHAVAVRVDDIEESDERCDIEATVYVNRRSQKGMVIGKNGYVIKRVRAAAVAELSELYERPVDVQLWVKVEENWGENFWILRQLGHA